MSTRTQIWLAVGFAVLITALTITATVLSKGKTGQDAVSGSTAPALTETDWTRGNKQAKVTLTEYGDFQCPACAQYEPIMQKLESEYGDRVLFGFRNFPLYQVHKYAGISAQAAEAAGLQGKYWEMHDLLYANQSKWSVMGSEKEVTNLFNTYAQQISIDTTRFLADLDAKAVRDKIQSDASAGSTADVNHTPTFFLNNTQIPNPQSYEQFKSVLDAALAATK
ncbi:DsbA family protein [Candidatus Kaiserbacteria bacterium]|nr:DsbA family protein [Candidatus Kaiserbacteria bacterium]